jgi:hypothetical protein
MLGGGLRVVQECLGGSSVVVKGWLVDGSWWLIGGPKVAC